jgi:F-box and WD-40 domain protein CDC4
LQRQILDFVDDPTTFARASQVSKRWREITSDDQAWKALSDKLGYRRMSSDSVGSSFNTASTPGQMLFSQFPRSLSPTRNHDSMSAIAESSDAESSNPLTVKSSSRKSKRAKVKSTHRSHFKHRYLVEAAWRKGGHMTARHITPDQGVVTSLHLTKKYIVVALDNAKIHVFNTKGDHQRTLQGHVMGVWAMVPWDDVLVSGGCDRDVRVWNMATG